MEHNIKIYKLINPIDDLPFYVGSTYCDLSTRLRQHISASEMGKLKNEMISDIISSGKMPLIEAIESIICQTEEEEIAALKRESFWIKTYIGLGYPMCNAIGIKKDLTPRVKRNYQKETNKSKPTGVRFNLEKLDFLQKRENTPTMQSAINFLLDYYWYMNGGDVCRQNSIKEHKTN